MISQFVGCLVNHWNHSIFIMPTGAYSKAYLHLRCLTRFWIRNWFIYRKIHEKLTLFSCKAVLKWKPKREKSLARVKKYVQVLCNPELNISVNKITCYLLWWLCITMFLALISKVKVWMSMKDVNFMYSFLLVKLWERSNSVTRGAKYVQYHLSWFLCPRWK